MDRMIHMMKRQNPGVYKTGVSRIIATVICFPTVCGDAHRIPLLNAAIIGVSTNPGLIVTTKKPLSNRRCRKPLVKVDIAALAEP